MIWRRQEAAARRALVGDVPIMRWGWGAWWVNFDETGFDRADREAERANGFRL